MKTKPGDLSLFMAFYCEDIVLRAITNKQFSDFLFYVNTIQIKFSLNKQVQKVTLWFYLVSASRYLICFLNVKIWIILFAIGNLWKISVQDIIIDINKNHSLGKYWSSFQWVNWIVIVKSKIILVKLWFIMTGKVFNFSQIVNESIFSWISIVMIWRFSEAFFIKKWN